MITIVLVSTFVLWLLAAACIPHLSHDRSQEPKWRLILCKAAYLYDVVYDTLIGRVLFWELKSQIGTLTKRLERHNLRQTWRGTLAKVFCWLISLIRGGKGHCT
jgi:hypothetical protein